MNTTELKALERNVRLRNGRRAIPAETARPFRDDALETLGHLVGYAAIAAVIVVAMYISLSIADTQYRVIDRINQENVHAQRP